MSFPAMLAAHDDAALEALASKGLVRRARRDLEAGLAVVSARSEAGATVTADGETVEIDARGPSAARCTCPAGGLCRHILLAAMALRAASDAVAAPQATPADAPTAASDICALSEAELMKFAGADWRAAVTLAAGSEGAAITPMGRNCQVELAGNAVVVTFIAGQALKNAIYKGPKTRARTAVVAAAIMLRARSGVGLRAGDEPSLLEATLTAEFLSGAGDTLARAARAVLAGASPVAPELLFDLAISARAEAAPRLTAELRTLARLASLATTRDVHFDPDGFLAQAARSFALIEALKNAPSNPDFTGSLRRDYRAGPPLDLLLLGASCWRNDSGARGLTVHGFAASEKRWYSAVQARGPGQDPSFDPKAAYRLALWGAGTAENLMGHAVHLPEPLVAGDNSIALTLPRPAAVASRLRSIDAVLESGAAHVRWEALRRDLSERFGGGLQRRALAAPALLAPAKFGGFAFDAFEQIYEWEAIDHTGEALRLTLPAGADDLALRLRRESRHIRLILVEASAGQDRPVLRPIAIYADREGALDIVNLSLDRWPLAKGMRGVIDAAQEALFKPKAPAAPPADALRRLAARALAAAAAIGAGTQPADLEDLARSCEAAGLITLAESLEHNAAEPGIAEALRTAYLASEIQAALVWV
jgi:hypothetical protein